MNRGGSGTGGAGQGPLRGFPVGRIGGVPIVVAPSWVLSVAVIAALGLPVISRVVPGTGTALAVAVAVVLAVLLGVSVLAHELGHCLAARILGMTVVGVRLYLLGGVSELPRAPRSPREEAIIAAAGPAVSAVLAGACWLLLAATSKGTVSWLLVLLLALSNLVIAAFNLLPALPLDGGRVLRAGVWRVSGKRRAGTSAAVVGGYLVAVALVVWAVLLLAANGSAGLFPAGLAVAMALFVAVGAASEQPSRRPPSGSTVAPVGPAVAPVGPAAASVGPAVSIGSMTRAVTQLPIDVSVGVALAAAGEQDVILVTSDGAVSGLLDVPAARNLAGQDQQAPASLVAIRFPPQAIVFTGDDPAELARRVSAVAGAVLLVIDDDGRPAGVLRRADFLSIEHGSEHGNREGQA